MRKLKAEHPAIALFVFTVACAMTFGEVSAQVATFTTQQYPLLGNTHIAADLNGDGRPDLAGAGANGVSVMLGNGDGTFRDVSVETGIAARAGRSRLRRRFIEPGCSEQPARDLETRCLGLGRSYDAIAEVAVD